MPTYDYRCKACGYEFEAIQKMSDEPLAECPECKGSVKRLIGAGAGIIFKGSGFYQTDYRSDSYKKDAARDTSTSSSSSDSKTSGSGTSSKADTKPASSASSSTSTTSS